MEESNNFTVKDAAVKNGIILGLVLTIFSFILTFAGMVGNNYIGMLNYVFIAVFVILAQNSFKTNGDGFMSFSQGIGIGTIVTLVGSLLSTIIGYFYTKFVDDSMVQLARDKAIQDLEARGLSSAEIDQAMQFSDKLLIPEVMYPIAIVVTVIVGVIISLIITLFTQKKDPSLEF